MAVLSRSSDSLPRMKSVVRCVVGLLVLAFALALQAQPYGMNSRPAIGAFLDDKMPEAAPAVSGNWSAVVAFTNLTFTNALGLTYVPGTNRLVVWEREGRVYSFA